MTAGEASLALLLVRQSHPRQYIYIWPHSNTKFTIKPCVEQSTSAPYNLDMSYCGDGPVVATELLTTSNQHETWFQE